jgi:hypothetical protein
VFWLAMLLMALIGIGIGILVTRKRLGADIFRRYTKAYGGTLPADGGYVPTQGFVFIGCVIVVFGCVFLIAGLAIR